MKWKLLFFFLCAWLFLIYLPLYALDPDKTLDQYQLDQWSVSDGLPSDIVGTIAQTPDGYLWIGTLNGLVRFDGVRFKVFSTKTHPEMLNNRIYALFVDKQAGLWIGTEKGLMLYKNGHFKHISINNSLSEFHVISIIENVSGSTWIGTLQNGLIRLENGKYTLYDTSKGLDSNLVAALLEDSKGNLWVGTGNKGLFKLKYGKFQQIPINGLEKDSAIFGLAEDRNGALWIGVFNKGLLRVKDESTHLYTTHQGLSSNKVLRVFEDSDGNLLVGTANGLNRVKKDVNGKTIIEKIYKNKIPIYFFEDREKNLWIGTKISGLLRLRDVPFKTYSTREGLPNIIISLYEDPQGVIWSGAVHKGLYTFKNNVFSQFSPPNKRLKKEIMDHLIRGMVKNRSGDFWVGTDGGGLLCIKKQAFTRYTIESGLVSNQVKKLFIDSQDHLWICTGSGISLYNNETGKFTTLAAWENTGHRSTFAFYEDKHHQILMGTPDGILVFEKEGGEFKHKKKYLQGIGISTICQDDSLSPVDPENVLWIGTIGSGLKRLKNRTFTSCSMEDGLGSNAIYQILPDEQGYFWMSSDNGVLRARKNQLDEFMEGRIKKIDCQVFGVEHGLKSTNCNLAAIKTRANELWFSTNKGIAVVNPGKMKIKKPSLPPLTVLIEQITVNGKEVEPEEMQNQMVFYDVEHIAFHFTAPSFTAPDKIPFKYKLEGFDRDWVLHGPGKERVAIYTNLPAQAYRFNVTAASSSGTWDTTGASIELSLKKRFFKSPGFIIILVLIVLLLAITALVMSRKIHWQRTKNAKKITANKTITPSNHQADQYLNQLLHLLKNEKIYRTENLLIQSVSERLSIPSYLLSKIIKEKLNKNFSELINSYRIEEARKRLADPRERDTTILEIAYDVGFNSKTAFNKEFKKFTLMTPSQYRKKH